MFYQGYNRDSKQKARHVDLSDATKILKDKNLNCAIDKYYRR